MQEYKTDDFWFDMDVPEYEFDVITTTVGSLTNYEVYDRNELGKCIANEGLHPHDILKYLLSRIRGAQGRKITISHCQYIFDDDIQDYVAVGYRTLITGAYKEGTYKVSIDDEYSLHLDGD